MRLSYPALLFLTLILALGTPLQARTLAVFPLLDLTEDANGVNFSLTAYLSGKAAEQGFTVLPDSEVMAFMVRHRIRSLGVLTSHQLNNLRQELNTDFALLGTVCQLGQKPAAKVSLSLQLIRVTDGEPVWSVIRDLHEDDLISLLAIRNPQSLNDLYERYFSEILTSIPAEIKEGGSIEPSVGILTVNLHPRYVKPGERLEAEIRAYYNDPEAKVPVHHLLIDGKEYPVDSGGGARLLKATWLASDQIGQYPVDLVSIFPEGRQQVQRLGEYTVDGTVPEMSLNFFGSVIEDGEVYFNKQLTIVPLLKSPEIMSRWQIAVYDQDQELVLLLEESGHLPPQIIWNGMISESEAAADGRYRIQAQAWDQAENTTQAEGYVNLRRTNPKLKFNVELKEGEVHVQLDNEVQSPLAFWFVKVYETNGGLLASQVGETLPAALDFKLPAPDSNEQLDLFFAGQDRYGNRTYEKVEDLLNKGVKKKEKEIVPESDWLENF